MMNIERGCLNSELHGLVSIAGRCRKKGDLKAAETLLKHALRKAEDRFGYMSIPVAVVLLELVELHEDSNDADAARVAHKRMRQIIVSVIDNTDN